MATWVFNLKEENKFPQLMNDESETQLFDKLSVTLVFSHDGAKKRYDGARNKE